MATLTPKSEKTAESVSTVYGEAEIWLAEQLMLRCGRAFISPLKMTLSTGLVRVEIDAATPDRTVLAEIWSHIGKPRGDQPTKIVADAAKLRWVKEELRVKTGLDAKLVVVAGDLEAVAGHAGGNGWRAWGLQNDGIDIVVFPFPADIRKSIDEWLAAQRSASRRMKVSAGGTDAEAAPAGA